jgi:LysM repeat protein
VRRPAPATVVILLALGCQTARVEREATPEVAAPPPMPAAPSEPTWTYVVERGDTLSRIGRRYGASVDEIVRLNRIAEPDRIEIGQRLRIPLGSPRPAPPETASSEQRLRDYRRDLEVARRAVESADFRGAARRLRSLRARVAGDPAASTDLLLALEETSAHVHVALGAPEQATAAFERALGLRPGYEPAAVSPPKVMRAFRAAQRGFAGR